MAQCDVAELTISPDPTAVIGRRTFAALVDSFVVAVSLTVPIAVLGRWVDADDSPSRVRQTLDFVRDSDGTLLFFDGRPRLVSPARVLDFGETTIVFQGWPTVLAVYLIPLLTIFGIGVVAQARTGATPGKTLFGLRTVDELGRLPGYRNAIARTFGWIVDGFPFLIPLVGPILAFSSPGHQRLGDRLGRTFVVDKAFAGDYLEIPGLSPVPAEEEPERQVTFSPSGKADHTPPRGLDTVPADQRVNLLEPESEPVLERRHSAKARVDVRNASSSPGSPRPDTDPGTRLGRRRVR